MEILINILLAVLCQQVYYPDTSVLTDYSVNGDVWFTPSGSHIVPITFPLQAIVREDLFLPLLVSTIVPITFPGKAMVRESLKINGRNTYRTGI